MWGSHNIWQLIDSWISVLWNKYANSWTTLCVCEHMCLWFLRTRVTMNLTHQPCLPRQAPALHCSLCWWADRTDRSCPSSSQSTDSTVSQARCKENAEDRFYPPLSSPGERRADTLLRQISVKELTSHRRIQTIAHSSTVLRELPLYFSHFK